jgi:small conductance mechanosensitive channel
MDTNTLTETVVGVASNYGPKIVLAIVTLCVGWIVSAWAGSLTRKQLAKRNVDETLRPFLSGLVSIVVKVGVVITAVSTLGVEATSFAAVLAAAALAIGMALSGTLQNFAGGVMLLVFRPFGVGHVIEAQGFKGKVADIQLFQTRLLTPDNRTIYIPNGALSSGALVNFSLEDQRRVDFTFGIGYDDDIEEARRLILQVAASQGKVLTDPEPFVQVSELADSSVNFAVRLWCEADDYWDVFFYMNEEVKKTFDANGVSIPYPQQDVHMHDAAAPGLVSRTEDLRTGA